MGETTMSAATSSSSAATNGCPYCGDIYYHGAVKCPRVSAIEYHPNGSIKRIEFTHA